MTTSNEPSAQIREGPIDPPGWPSLAVGPEPEVSPGTERRDITTSSVPKAQIREGTRAQTIRMNLYGRFLTYDYCPRGAGDKADHDEKFLVHRAIPAGRVEVDGWWSEDGGEWVSITEPHTRLVCMDVQVAMRLDAALGAVAE